MLATLLQLWGYDVCVVSDGLAALRMAETYQPDVALLDIGLPGCDGYEVAAELRTRRAQHNKPFLVALTGHGREQDVKRAKEVGFDRHLTKPIEGDLLRKVLNQLLSNTTA